MKKNDPYAALRFREFNVFLLMRFAMVFAWSMQFIVIEWEVYSITKNPLSLGIIGLMEVIPAVSMALFAGHIVDQREKRSLLVKCILGFSVVSLGLFLITWPRLVSDLSTNTPTSWNWVFIPNTVTYLNGTNASSQNPEAFSMAAMIPSFGEVAI